MERKSMEKHIYKSSERLKMLNASMTCLRDTINRGEPQRLHNVLCDASKLPRTNAGALAHEVFVFEALGSRKSAIPTLAGRYRPNLLAGARHPPMVVVEKARGKTVNNMNLRDTVKSINLNSQLRQIARYGGSLPFINDQYRDHNFENQNLADYPRSCSACDSMLEQEELYNLELSKPSFQFSSKVTVVEQLTDDNSNTAQFNNGLMYGSVKLRDNCTQTSARPVNREIHKNQKTVTVSHTEYRINKDTDYHNSISLSSFAYNSQRARHVYRSYTNTLRDYAKARLIGLQIDRRIIDKNYGSRTSKIYLHNTLKSNVYERYSNYNFEDHCSINYDTNDRACCQLVAEFKTLKRNAKRKLCEEEQNRSPAKTDEIIRKYSKQIKQIQVETIQLQENLFKRINKFKRTHRGGAIHQSLLVPNLDLSQLNLEEFEPAKPTVKNAISVAELEDYDNFGNTINDDEIIARKFGTVAAIVRYPAKTTVLPDSAKTSEGISSIRELLDDASFSIGSSSKNIRQPHSEIYKIQPKPIPNSESNYCNQQEQSSLNEVQLSAGLYKDSKDINNDAIPLEDAQQLEKSQGISVEQVHKGKYNNQRDQENQEEKIKSHYSVELDRELLENALYQNGYLMDSNWISYNKNYAETCAKLSTIQSESISEEICVSRDPEELRSGTIVYEDFNSHSNLNKWPIMDENCDENLEDIILPNVEDYELDNDIKEDQEKKKNRDIIKQKKQVELEQEEQNDHDNQKAQIEQENRINQNVLTIGSELVEKSVEETRLNVSIEQEAEFYWINESNQKFEDYTSSGSEKIIASMGILGTDNTIIGSANNKENHKKDHMILVNKTGLINQERDHNELASLNQDRNLEEDRSVGSEMIFSEIYSISNKSHQSSLTSLSQLENSKLIPDNLKDHEDHIESQNSKLNKSENSNRVTPIHKNNSSENVKRLEQMGPSTKSQNDNPIINVTSLTEDLAAKDYLSSENEDRLQYLDSFSEENQDQVQDYDSVPLDSSSLSGSAKIVAESSSYEEKNQRKQIKEDSSNEEQRVEESLDGVKSPVMRETPIGILDNKPETENDESIQEEIFSNSSNDLSQISV